MPRFDSTRQGVWSAEMVPGAYDARTWDVAQSKAVNAWAGGTWSPSSPIVFGGAGIAVSAGGITGPLSTATGGRVVLAKDDYIRVPSQKKQVAIPIHIARVPHDGVGAITAYSANGVTGIQTTSPVLIVPIPNRFMLDGAAIYSVALWYRVVSPFLPADPVRIELYRSSGKTPRHRLAPPSDVVPTDEPVWVSAGQCVVFSRTYYVALTSGDAIVRQDDFITKTPGEMVSSGGVTWQCVGSTGEEDVSTLDKYFRNGYPKSLLLHTPPSLVADESCKFVMEIHNANDVSTDRPHQNMILHGVGVTFQFDQLRFF